MEGGGGGGLYLYSVEDASLGKRNIHDCSPPVAITQVLRVR